TFTSGINKDRPPVPGGSVVSAIAGSFSYFARALSLELAPTRVNIVSPGWVDTPMFDELAGAAKLDLFADMAARLPAGRIATPAAIAPAYNLRHAKRIHDGTDASHRRWPQPDLTSHSSALLDADLVRASFDITVQVIAVRFVAVGGDEMVAVARAGY